MPRMLDVSGGVPSEMLGSSRKDPSLKPSAEEEESSTVEEQEEQEEEEVGQVTW